MDEEKKENFDNNIPNITHGENKSNMTEKVRKNPWIVTTFILGALILLFVAGNAFGLTGNLSLTGKVVSGSAAGNNLVAYLEDNGYTAEISSVKESDGFYLINISINGEEQPIYMTKDGKNVVSLMALSTEETEEVQEEIPKTDKPVVELFVMSFCPYGVKAENNIMPVIESLGDKIDFKIRFIVNSNGDTIEDVSSLHGLYETKEDARQVVIMKYYPDKFYDYLKEFDSTCYPLGNDETKLDACWKATAKKFGMDTSKIETVAYGKEGVDLLKAEEAIANQYSVSGSPTLIINGVQSSAIYSGTSSTQAAICSAFNTAPTMECSTQLADSTSTTTSGSC